MGRMVVKSKTQEIRGRAYFTVVREGADRKTV